MIQIKLLTACDLSLFEYSAGNIQNTHSLVSVPWISYSYNYRDTKTSIEDQLSKQNKEQKTVTQPSSMSG